MNTKDLENVSLRGKIAYATMCIEKYLLKKFPDRNWKPLANVMWEGTSDYWDSWSSKMIEIIPENLFELDTYTDFESITYEEWITFRKLLRDTGNDLNQILHKLQQIEEVYCYTEIDDHGLLASQLVIDITTYLLKEEINYPDLKLISFSTYDQKYGRGNSFDGRYLSIIL